MANSREEIEMFNAKKELISSLNNSNQITTDEQIASFAKIVAIARAKLVEDKFYASKDNKVKDDIFYENREKNIQTVTNNLKNNPLFQAYVRGIEDVKEAISKNDSRVYDDWNDYRNDIKKDLIPSAIEDTGYEVATISINKKLTAEGIQQECRENAEAIEIVHHSFDNKDIIHYADYFVLKLVTEPGAKRSIFNKGVDINKEKNAGIKRELIPDKDGCYDRDKFLKFLKRNRDSLLSNPAFLKLFATGKPVKAVYEDFKREQRRTVEEIAKVTTLSKNIINEKKNETIILEEEQVNYYKKTLGELDSLYQKNGKYSSEYIKNVRNSLNQLITEAENSNNNGKGYEIKSEKINELQRHSVIYFKERKGKVFSAPLTDRGKQRLALVENMINKTNKFIKNANKPKLQNKAIAQPKK